MKHPKKEEWLRLAGHSFGKDGGARLLNVRLIHQYLRRMEFRGSDVRLDLQVVYRPDAAVRTTVDPRRWVWKTAQSYERNEHINLLELRAILRSLEWRARSASFHSCRFLHLSDSQICFDKRSQQLKKDQPHFAENLSLVPRSESVSVAGLDCILSESSGWSKQALREGCQGRKF